MDITIAMDPLLDKENIAEGLRAPLEQKPQSPAKKTSKKSRSLSIGPGALNTTVKVDFSNRRKSAIIPSVKSILPIGDDQATRRAARRKSLANRRVSFAPEATLHTWDVIEYMKDATTSTASSEETRRASMMQPPAVESPSKARAESPSTPPKQLEELAVVETPESQRKKHQKQRRRRSSGIPPMNFNNPDEAFSSSPYSDGSPLASDPIEIHEDISDAESNSGTSEASMTMDLEDATNQSIGSPAAAEVDSTSSSARLDEALRQAADQAATHQDFQAMNGGDMTMDLVEDEITNAFKPWAQRADGQVNKNVVQAFEHDKENFDSFSPPQQLVQEDRRVHELSAILEQSEDLSMDMTRAIGRILDSVAEAASSQAPSQQPHQSPARGTKRRISSVISADDGTSQGSPVKKPISRRSSVRRRRTSVAQAVADDETMDFTVAFGGIASMDLDTANFNRRQSIASSFGDETMDFTMVVGGLGTRPEVGPNATRTVDEDDEAEDMSMELTTTLDKTIVVNAPKLAALHAPVVPASGDLKPATPVRSPMKTSDTPSSSLRTTNASANKTSRQSPQKSPRKSSRKSISRSPVKQDTALPMQTKDASTTIEDVPATPIASVASHELKVLTPQEERLLGTPVRGSTFFSPLARTSVPPTAVTEESSKPLSISDSIKLMSTPRKGGSSSPLKRVTATPEAKATPRKVATPKKLATPRRSASPRKKQVTMRADVVDNEAEAEPVSEIAEPEVERISLQDFLSLTNIKFMDLTTTKRRHTGYPGADAKLLAEDDDTPTEEANLENNVAVAVSVVPVLSMYQHSCQEMKNYINGGRAEIKNLEAEAFEVQPPLFREYLSATADVRTIMDNQFKNMKTNARLQSKSGWHAWRSQLLDDLKAGLMQTVVDLEGDESLLAAQENVLSQVVPGLEQRSAELRGEHDSLQRRKEEYESEDREELDAARQRLLAADGEIAQKKQLIEQLRAELEAKTEQVEFIQERKAETTAQIQEAERVRDSCRGWSVDEVNSARAKLSTLEQEHGWRLTSTDPSTNAITLIYLSDLQLYLHPSAFSTNSKSPTPNAPISLTYIGDASKTTKSQPLTDSKRFFLQLLRAHLHCISQSQVTIKSLLDTISSGWDAALAVTEAVRRLNQISLADERILSDETLAIDTTILLPTVQTKVRARFEIKASLPSPTSSSTGVVETDVSVDARVVYGEKYDEKRMGEFLMGFVGGLEGGRESMGSWADGVEDLRGRLVKRGAKGGVRVQ